MKKFFKILYPPLFGTISIALSIIVVALLHPAGNSDFTILTATIMTLAVCIVGYPFAFICYLIFGYLPFLYLEQFRLFNLITVVSLGTILGTLMMWVYILLAHAHIEAILFGTVAGFTTALGHYMLHK